MNTKERFFKLLTKIKETEKKKKFELFKKKFRSIQGREPTDFEFVLFHYGFDYGKKYEKSIKRFKTKYFKSEDKDKFLEEFE